MATEAMRVSSTRELLRARGPAATLFAAAFLAFLLPFGTVSCGVPVTFTGAELAAGRVHGGDPEIVAGANHGLAPTIAKGALFAAALGFVFAVLGLRRQGWIALSGLVLLALLPWVAALALADDWDGRSGYWLASAGLGGVVAIRATALVRERQARGRRIWPAAVALCLLGLFVGVSLLSCLPGGEAVGGETTALLAFA